MTAHSTGIAAAEPLPVPRATADAQDERPEPVDTDGDVYADLPDAVAEGDAPDEHLTDEHLTEELEID